MQCDYALQAPDDDTLASFLGALPMMFSIAILSPHGFFGQTGVFAVQEGGQRAEMGTDIKGLKRC